MTEVCWDLESLHSLEDLGLDPNSRESWAEYRHKCGISWAVAHDGTRYHHFSVHNPVTQDTDTEALLDMVHMLERADTVFGFNTEGFDQPVVQSMIRRPLRIRRHVDLWPIIKSAVRSRDGTWQWGKGLWTLGAISSRCFGEEKTKEGALAPQLAKNGFLGQLATYCEQDVRLVKLLVDHIRTQGCVLDPKGDPVTVVLPGVMDAPGRVSTSTC